MTSAIPRKAITPLRSTGLSPSNPYEAMTASQAAHIDELVKKNNSLEQSNSQLRDELGVEQARSRDAVKALQKQWKDERAQWAEGCDTLQACHRIAHLRTLKELDEVRMSVLEEREVARMERVKSMQRDYKLVMFQGRETELELRVEELEEELEGAKEEAESGQTGLADAYEEQMEKLKAKCKELVGQVKEKNAQLAEVITEKEDTEVSSPCSSYF